MFSFSTHSHTHISAQTRTAAFTHKMSSQIKKCTETHACGDTEKEDEITWLVMLSLTVIQHHGQNHMCSNRDKNRHICTPHKGRCAVEQWEVPGAQASESFNCMCVLTG